MGLTTMPLLTHRHFVAAALCLAATCAASAELPVKITTFASDKPAVPSLTGSARTPTAFPGSTGPALIMTSFKPFAHDTVTVVPDVGAAVASGSVSASLLEDVTVWPNMANMVPYDEFKCAAVLIAGGFLVPGKSVGSIDVFTPEADQDSQTFNAS